TLTADSASMVADGQSTTRVLVTVRDVYGNPVGASAGTVILATSLGSLGDITDHGDGTYTATFTAGTIAGSVTITGTLNGEAIADTAVVELRIEPGSPMTTTIEADSTSLVTDVFSWTTITVTVRDATGAPVGASAGAVTLHTTAGHLGSVVDHGDGTYTAQLKAVGDSPQAVVTGTLNGAAIADSAVVEFRQGSREASTAPAASVRYAVSRYNDTSTDISFVEPRFTPANSRSQQRSSGS